jgi:hypothetical protein
MWNSQKCACRTTISSSTVTNIDKRSVLVWENATVKTEDSPESMDSIRRRYILRYAEEHNRLDARDN